MKTTVCSFLALSLLAACGGSEVPADETAAASEDIVGGRAGAVYTMSNAADGNVILVYRRANDGSLQLAASHATTGKGSGDGLGSQGSLTLGQDRRFLFAVNAGSNELSVFHVAGEKLYLVDTLPTGGIRPVSVAEHDGLVYVLHAGDGANDVRGFVQRSDGKLRALEGSTRALSAPTTGPAEVAFSPTGRTLLVTEKATNTIDELRVDLHTGLASAAVSHPSSGQTPFGFAVNARGEVIVSEANGGMPGASTVSSYQVGASSGLRTVSAAIPNQEGAACWVVLERDLAFVSNTASGSISTYHVGPSGTLDLVEGRAADTGEGSKPTDMAFTRNGKYLYVLESGTGSLGVLAMKSDGTLAVQPDVEGLPPFATGLAAE